MKRNETTALAEPEGGQVEAVEMPEPDLSVMAEQPVEAAEQPQDKPKEAQDKQELTETTPASVGLVVGLVVVSIVAAVVVAMWMVSPLLALLLGAGLILVAVLAAGGWLAWQRWTRRSKTGRDRSGRDRSGRGDRPGKSPKGGGKSPNGRKAGDGWWPFSRNKTAGGGGKTPGGGGKTPTGGKAPAGGGRPTGGKPGWWPFSRSRTPGGGGKAKAPKSPAAGQSTGDRGKKRPGDKSAWWPFSRNKSAGGGGRTPAGGGKAPAARAPRLPKVPKLPRAPRPKAPAGGGRPTGDRGKRPAGDGRRRARTAGGAALLGLVGLVRAARKSKSGDKPGKDEPKPRYARATPGGLGPETVIDVDLDDIASPQSKSHAGGSTGSARSHRSAPRTAPFDSGAAAGSGWWRRSVSTSLHSTPHGVGPVGDQFGGPEMSTITTSSTSADQDAMRVANRYAEMIEKAETLQARASACRDAADQYRRDARDNQESAENHKMAARTIRDVNVAHEHAVAAREAEAEAAREILAARFYEAQAEQYEADARSIGF